MSRYGANSAPPCPSCVHAYDPRDTGLVTLNCLWLDVSGAPVCTQFIGCRVKCRCVASEHQVQSGEQCSLAVPGSVGICEAKAPDDQNKKAYLPNSGKAMTVANQLRKNGIKLATDAGAIMKATVDQLSPQGAPVKMWAICEKLPEQLSLGAPCKNAPHIKRAKIGVSR